MHNNAPPRDKERCHLSLPETRLSSVRLARTRKEQPTTSNCSLRLAMFTCGACADEIVVQEGIRHPGHACKSPLHAPLQYLHSATMCDAVWQPLEDGEDTFCSKACVAAYNAKLKAEHEDGLAGVPVEDEPLPPPDFLPLRQSSSCGASSPVRGGMQTPSIGEPGACWTRWPPPRTLERL